MALRDWVRLPSAWIQERGLCDFRWSGGGWPGADYAAALMVLAVVAHFADEETGEASLTYDQLNERTGLSRSKISAGFDVLEHVEVIHRGGSGRSSVALRNYGLENRWAKLPAKRLYSGGRVSAFHDLTLRKAADLNALKLYFLFAARRGDDTNMANISYNKIEEYTGLDRSRIKTAVSLLAGQGLIHVEHIPSLRSDYGIANAYRLAHIAPRQHMGTRGRGMDAADFEWPND